MICDTGWSMVYGRDFNIKYNTAKSNILDFRSKIRLQEGLCPKKYPSS